MIAKAVIAVILSAALISLAPKHDTPVNNLASRTKVQSVRIAATEKADQKIQMEPKDEAKPEVQTASAVKQVPQGCAAYLPLISQYDWDHSIAFAIMQAENTGCNPAKDNAGLNDDGSVDYGLFQVNSVHADMVDYDLERLRDPATNIATAYRIYSGSGWKAWSTYNNGAFYGYL